MLFTKYLKQNVYHGIYRLINTQLQSTKVTLSYVSGRHSSLDRALDLQSEDYGFDPYTRLFKFTKFLFYFFKLFICQLYNHNTLNNFNNKLAFYLNYFLKKTYRFFQIKISNFEDFQYGRSSLFVSVPINLKFIWKRYNHNTLNKF